MKILRLQQSERAIFVARPTKVWWTLGNYSLAYSEWKMYKHWDIGNLKRYAVIW
jgi:hypothetical protein